jgi:divinyl chlorophyllide a 8-vinyl-reductase
MMILRKFGSFLVITVAVVIPSATWVSALSLWMSSASTGKTAVIAGATGYIGKWVVKEANRQGYKTVALVRDKSKIDSNEGQAQFGKYFEGCQIVECDVCNPEQLTMTMQKISSENGGIDGIVSCLASRSGIKKDAFAIDYQATKNCLDAGMKVGARHFVLLSAFCVKNPWLQFQKGR